MLNILLFLLDVLDRHVIWLYLLCLGLVLINLRSYLVAHGERVNTIYTIEKEVAAHKEGQAMSAIGAALGIAAVITALKYYAVPTIDVETLAEPTPTYAWQAPTPVPTPTPTMPTSTPTLRPRPTRAIVLPTKPPTITPMPYAPCPDPNTAITFPLMDQGVSGTIVLQGTANHPQFQFYKLEFGFGAEPEQWSVIGDLHDAPIVNGPLGQFDTTVVPNGQYWIQVTAVDQTGNFPPPCRVRVTIQN